MVQQVSTTSAATEVSRFQEPQFGPGTMQRSVVYLRRVSWGAIFAGAFVAIAVQTLLTLLGAGIGMIVVGNQSPGQGPGTGMTIAAGVWWLISGIISLFCGGLVAGRLSGVALPMEGMLHGLAVWALTTVISLFAVTASTTAVAGGALSTVNQWMTTPEGRATINQNLNQNQGGSSGGQQQPGQGSAGSTGNQSSNQQQGPQISEADAKQAASNAGKAALWAFFAMLLGAIAAAIGGSTGRHMGDDWGDRDSNRGRTSRSETTISDEGTRARTS